MCVHAQRRVAVRHVAYLLLELLTIKGEAPGVGRGAHARALLDLHALMHLLGEGEELLVGLMAHHKNELPDPAGCPPCP